MAKYAIKVDNAGVAVFWLDTGSHIKITDLSGNQIKHVEYARSPELGQSLIIADFPSAGTYFIDESDTDVQDPSFLKRWVDWSSMPSDETDTGNFDYKQTLKLLIPLKTYVLNFSGHSQGVCVYNGYIYVSVKDRIIKVDPDGNIVEDPFISLSDIQSNSSQNHIGSIHIDSNGIIHIPLEYWDGSKGTYKEIVDVDINTKEVKNRISLDSLSDISDVGGVYYDGTYYHISDYVNGKIFKIDPSGPSIVSSVDTPSNPQGVGIIDGNYVSTFDNTGANSLQIYINGSWVPILVPRYSSNPSVEGICTNGNTISFIYECGDTKHIVIGQIGYALQLRVNSTNGANRYLTVPTDNDNISVVGSFVYFGYYGNNPALGIGLMDDTSNGILVQQTHNPHIDFIEFSGGSYTDKAGFYLIPDSCDRDTNYQEMLDAPVILFKKSGSNIYFKVLNMLDHIFSDTTSKGGSASGISYRIWRLGGLFGPLAVFGYQDTDPNVYAVDTTTNIKVRRNKIWEYVTDSSSSYTKLRLNYYKRDSRIVKLTLVLKDSNGNQIGSTDVDVSSQSTDTVETYSVSIANNLSPVTISPSTTSLTVKANSIVHYTAPSDSYAIIPAESNGLEIHINGEKYPFSNDVIIAPYTTVIIYNPTSNDVTINIQTFSGVNPVELTLEVQEKDSNGNVIYSYSTTIEEMPPLTTSTGAEGDSNIDYVG